MAIAEDVRIQHGYKIRGIEPPDMVNYGPDVRKLYWSWVVELGLKRKDRELSQGLDKDGKPLKPISEETRRNRRSAMTPSGEGDPEAPPLIPGWQKSRTRSLLAGRAFTTHAAFFWKYDAWTGASWAVVLSYQAAKGRDVFGLSTAGIAWVKGQSWALWTTWKRGNLRLVKAAQPKARELATPKYGTRHIEDITGGVSTSGKAVKFIPGRRWGYSTPEQTRAYFTQTASAKIPGRAMSPKFKPFAGPKYNVLLKHVWGQLTKRKPKV